MSACRGNVAYALRLKASVANGVFEYLYYKSFTMRGLPVCVSGENQDGLLAGLLTSREYCFGLAPQRSFVPQARRPIIGAHLHCLLYFRKLYGR